MGDRPVDKDPLLLGPMWTIWGGSSADPQVGTWGSWAAFAKRKNFLQ